MHSFRTALLAAAAIGAGLPALASAQPDDRRADGEQHRERPDRGQADQRSDQGQRQPGGQSERAQNQQQQQQVQATPPQQQQPTPQAQPSQMRADGRGFDRGNRGERTQDFRQQGQNPDQGQRAVQGQRGFAGGDDRRPGVDQRQGDPRPGFAGNAYRGGDQRFGYDRGRDERGAAFRGGAGGPQGRVGADWRNDRRYDWRGYRDQHREIFRAGRYQPPRAYYRYGYRPFEIGVRLEPFFYASNYWIDDPYDYRLPPVWGSYRWVRYYDDVLLVDLASGEVVDVIHQFFW